MKQYILLVIDMQRWFAGSLHPGLIEAVKREMRAAVKLGFPIVRTEIPYWSPLDEEPFPPTHKELTGLLNGYGRQKLVEKLMWQDGATNVISACEHAGFKTKCFRLCGVRADGCVLAMARGLARELPGCKLEVVMDACNSDDSTTPQTCWDRTTKDGSGDKEVIVRDAYLAIPNVKLLSPECDGERKEESAA